MRVPRRVRASERRYLYIKIDRENVIMLGKKVQHRELKQNYFAKNDLPMIAMLMPKFLNTFLWRTHMSALWIYNALAMYYSYNYFSIMRG